MGRAPCCDKAIVKKGPWSPEEDAKLKDYIDKYGTGGNWIALPQKVGLNRCGKSCRLRWLNYLRPNIKHGGFTEEEDRIICSLYISIGSRWSIIAAQLPGRTDNDIKNYWNTKLKKKLLAKQKNSNRLSPNGPNELSKSALERLQLHMQFQNPLSFHNIPTFWPRLDPLQESILQNLQPLSDNYTPLNQTAQMHELMKSDPSLKIQENYRTESSLNGMSNSSDNSMSYSSGNNFLECLNSSNVPKPDIQQVSTLQTELEDILNNKATAVYGPRVDQAAEFDYLKEMNATKGESALWTNNFESKSTSSWDSSSGFQAEGMLQDYELDYNLC